MRTTELVNELKELAFSYTPVSIKSLLNMLLECEDVEQIYIDHDCMYTDEVDGKLNGLIALQCGSFNLWVAMYSQTEVYINQLYHYLYINGTYNIDRTGKEIEMRTPKEAIDFELMLSEMIKIENVYDNRILNQDDEDEEYYDDYYDGDEEDDDEY